MSQKGNASRILFVKNLDVKTTADDCYELFSRYGSVQQVQSVLIIRTARGNAYVVYYDLNDAKTAFEHLNGFNLSGRYLTILFFSHQKQQEKDLAKREADLAALKAKHKIDDDAAAT